MHGQEYVDAGQVFPALSLCLLKVVACFSGLSSHTLMSLFTGISCSLTVLHNLVAVISLSLSAFAPAGLGSFQNMFLTIYLRSLTALCWIFQL